MQAQLELCLASDQGPLAENIQLASAAGVGSIELCAAMDTGGLTPTGEAIALARRYCTGRTQLRVMIRPRAGSFCYRPQERQLMAQQIAQAADLGADGVVFGCLTESGGIDQKAMELLMQLCIDYRLSSTFHRAFDAGQPHKLMLQALTAYPLERILTNGCRWQSGLGIQHGCEQLQYLQLSSKVQWIFGGGLTLGLLPELQQTLKPAYWHFHSALLQQHRLQPELLAQALQCIGQAS